MLPSKCYRYVLLLPILSEVSVPVSEKKRKEKLSNKEGNNADPKEVKGGSRVGRGLEACGNSRKNFAVAHPTTSRKHLT